MNLDSQTTSESQKFDSSYFLKLAAALIILAAVYFGSYFFNGKQNLTSQNKEQADFSPPQSEKTLAATLPVAQDAFLIAAQEIILPIRKWDIEPPEFSAPSLFSWETNSGKILFEKQAEEKRPIASLSKLMTALVVIERANLQDEIIISQKAIETYGEMGNLVTGEKISIESLLYALLVESSNDAAVALAEKFNGQFVDFMNQKAKEFNLTNTKFSDPSGLSIENISTAKDLMLLITEVAKYPILTQMMKTPEIDIASADGQYRHHLINSNKLLAKYPEIIAGKTGYIDEAGGCIVLGLEAPNKQGRIINVILGSQDRIGEMDKLIQWEKEGFLW